MVTLGNTIAVPGIRLTSPSDTFNVCWRIESTLALIDQGEGVAYTVYANDVLVDGGVTTNRRVVQPNFSAMPSRMPGNRGGQATFHGYGVTLTAGALPPGLVRIDAVAQGHDGSLKVLDSTWFLNDSDGGDRRHSNRVVHFRPQTGNDANGGTGSGDAVLSLPRAFSLAAVAGNAGGAVIVCHEDIRGNGNTGNLAWPSVQTGADQWLSILFLNGATWQVRNPTSSNTSTGSTGDYIQIPIPSSQWFRLRLIDHDILGTGPTLWSSSDGQLEVWREGGRFGSEHWDGNGPRARFEEDSGGASGGTAINLFQQSVLPGEVNNKSPGRIYVTGERRQGGRIGYVRETFIYDCSIEGMLGGNLYFAGLPYRRIACCVTHTDHNHFRNVTRGWGANRTQGFLPAEPLEAVDIGGGLTRILGPIGGLAFGEALADNIGADFPKIGVLVAGWPGLNGNYEIIDAGTDGSNRPYVDITATGTTGAAPGGADLETSLGGVRFNILIHPSSLSVDSGHADSMFCDIASFGITGEIQSHFSNGKDQLRLLIANVREGGGGANWNMDSDLDDNTGSYIDCIIRNVSAPQSGILIGNDPTRSFAGSQMTNSVFGQPGGLATAIAAGLEVSYCHFVTGSAGSNSTSGPWVIDNPTAGTGDPRIVDPTEWAWGAGSTKGATKNVAIPDWSLGAGPATVSATAASSISVATAATVGLGVQAAAASSIEVTTAAGVEVGANATAASSISVTTAASTALGRAASAASSISVATSATVGLELPPVVTPPPVTPSRAQSATAGVRCEAVSPSNTEIVEANELYFGGAGTVIVENARGDLVPISAVAGAMLPIRSRRIRATGTDATGIVAIF